MHAPTPHSSEQRPADRKAWTIRKKLVFLTALLVAGISLFIYLFFPAQLERQAVETIAAKAASIAEMSAYTLAPALDFNNVDEVEEALQAALQFEDALYAYVQDTDGAFVGSFLKDTTNTSTLIALSPEDGIGPYGRVYHVRRPIASHGRVLGYLYMGFSLQPLNEELNRSRLVLALVSLLVFLVGMGAAYGISVFITRPLGQIVHTVDRIAQGDLTQRAAVTSRDEVGHLATSFNKMVDSLESAYDAIQTSEVRFRAVIEYATDIIGLLDKDGDILYLSPSIEEVVGYPPDDLIGRSVFEYVHSDDVAVLRHGLQQGADNPDVTLTAEVRWRHRDGSWRILSYRGRSLLDHPGIESILITARDITENKRFEQELMAARDQAEEMVQLKNAFLANMSHEIRTPLTGILGYAQILLTEVGEEQRELVETITHSGHRLMNTLNSVLDLAQLEARSIILERRHLDVGAEVAEAVQLLKPISHENVAVNVVAPPTPVFADLDQQGLQRILTNLIGNALKFTERGSVDVHVESDEHRVRIRVRDTGVGISKEFLPHIFDEFKQESTGMSRSHEGNGLGLSITKQLTEMMDGTISVESIKGLGSVFTLTFPRLAAPALDAPPERAPPRDPIAPDRPPADPRPEPEPERLLSAAPPPDRPATAARADDRDARPHRRVLIVEDNVVTRKMIERILLPHYAVESAASGTDALEAAERLRFDAVLMDINLGPGKDGVDTMRDLRTDPEYQKIPVIAVTAYAMPEDRKRFLEEGFDDYLSKPFKRDQLLQLLTRYLQPHGSA